MTIYSILNFFLYNIYIIEQQQSSDDPVNVLEFEG